MHTIELQTIQTLIRHAGDAMNPATASASREKLAQWQLEVNTGTLTGSADALSALQTFCTDDSDPGA